MYLLVDVIALILAVSITYLFYKLYYKLFVINYVIRIKKIIQNGETEKANKMKQTALKRQPKRMKQLLGKYGVN